MSPSLNGLGPDRPLAIGMQIDDDEPEVSYYIPNAAPGSLPDAWNDWVSDNVVLVPLDFTADPGAHTLTVSTCLAIRETYSFNFRRCGWLSLLWFCRKL